MKVSARNLLKCKVVKVEPGVVNTVVTLELPDGQEIISVITCSSAERLGLKEGTEAMAMIKASSVMIAVD